MSGGIYMICRGFKLHAYSSAIDLSVNEKKEKNNINFYSNLYFFIWNVFSTFACILLKVSLQWYCTCDPIWSIQLLKKTKYFYYIMSILNCCTIYRYKLYLILDWQKQTRYSGRQMDNIMSCYSLKRLKSTAHRYRCVKILPFTNSFRWSNHITSFWMLGLLLNSWFF